MKIPLIIISIVLTLSVFIPFYLFIYYGIKNMNNIKSKINSILKNNAITYNFKEIWRNNFIGISADKKVLTYIQVNNGIPIIMNIAMAEIKHCNIIKNLNKDKDKIVRLKKLDLEIFHKSSNKANSVITFYNEIDNSTEDYEIERIEKWNELIKNAIPEQTITRLAS